MMKDEPHTEYLEGFRARLAGQTIHQNPFATFTKAHSKWEEGWKDQDHHLTARDQALDSIGWFG
jgi:ribosome modulation factor